MACAALSLLFSLSHTGPLFCLLNLLHSLKVKHNPPPDSFHTVRGCPRANNTAVPQFFPFFWLGISRLEALLSKHLSSNSSQESKHLRGRPKLLHRPPKTRHSRLSTEIRGRNKRAFRKFPNRTWKTSLCVSGVWWGPIVVRGSGSGLRRRSSPSSGHGTSSGRGRRRSTTVPRPSTCCANDQGACGVGHTTLQTRKAEFSVTSQAVICDMFSQHELRNHRTYNTHRNPRSDSQIVAWENRRNDVKIHSEPAFQGSASNPRKPLLMLPRTPAVISM